MHTAIPAFQQFLCKFVSSDYKLSGEKGYQDFEQRTPAKDFQRNFFRPFRLKISSLGLQQSRSCVMIKAVLDKLSLFSIGAISSVG
jgi:hypothetical protein